jgi:hypothetical protein
MVRCEHCGKFALTRSLLASLPAVLARGSDARPKLSHALRRAQETQDSPLIGTAQAEAILLHPLPSPQEQADLVLRWLANAVAGPGELTKVNFRLHGAIFGCKSKAGLSLVMQYLFDANLVTGELTRYLDGGVEADATPTFAGWSRIQQLKLGQVAYRRAFMAMKFGDPALDKVLNDSFRRSAKRAGFDLFKLDDSPKAGLIDNRLRVEIQSSDFVIADLSHDNLGAYWEAGYAEGLGKPVIYTCERSKFEQTRTHFDTNHHLTILWDALSPETCCDELTATIRATLPHLAVLSD